jgi:hypothetical protein
MQEETMRRFLIVALALVALGVAPEIARAACINVQAGDWDDCSERRGAREPASWCGGGGGSSPGGSWRQRREADLEDAIAKIKASFASLVAFKPTYGD